MACSNERYLPNYLPLQPAPFDVPGRIRVALVLGSGGIRGLAHVGVLEELEKAGIPIDLIVGCSAGGIVGALYADCPSTKLISPIMTKVRTNAMLDINLFCCKYGLSEHVGLKQLLKEHLHSKTFEELRIPLIVVASDLHTGELIPIASGPIIPAVQASSSIPFVYKPCKHLGRVLIDGSVIDPIPVKIAKDLGAEIIIAVDLCELLPPTYPTNLFEIATRSAEIASMWQNEVCTRNAHLVIRPKTCGVGTFSDSHSQVLLEAGRKAARKKLDYLRELIDFHENREGKWEKKPPRTVQLYSYTPQIYHQ
jgi:NTE family protein